MRMYVRCYAQRNTLVWSQDTLCDDLHYESVDASPKLISSKILSTVIQNLSFAVSPILGEHSTKHGKHEVKTMQNQGKNTANEEDNAHKNEEATVWLHPS